MSKLVDLNGLAKVAKALDDKAQAELGAAMEAEVLARNNAIAAEAEARQLADTFENGITTVNALGGIKAGVSLDGKTVTEILDMLLFPYVAQTVSNVKGNPNGGTFEKGNHQVITSVTCTVTKKSKPITSIQVLQGSQVIAEKTGDEVKNGGSFTFSGLSVAVNSTNVQLTVKAIDTEGTEVTGTTAAFTFVYPYYMGVCAEGATVDETMVKALPTKKIESKGNKSFTYNTDNQCFVFAYPKAHGELKSVLDPNSFEILGSFTKHEVSVTGLDGTAQAYYVYVGGANTNSGFVVNFKY